MEVLCAWISLILLCIFRNISFILRTFTSHSRGSLIEREALVARPYAVSDWYTIIINLITFTNWY